MRNGIDAVPPQSARLKSDRMKCALAKRGPERIAPIALAPIAVFLALAATGCASLDSPDQSPNAGFQCVDDSMECIQRRQAALRQLVGDKERKWVKEAPSAEAYASGVRLFALKSKKRELTCDELVHARKEADGAPRALRAAQGTSLTPAQVSRGAMLAAEVSRELGNEFNKRCKKA